MSRGHGLSYAGRMNIHLRGASPAALPLVLLCLACGYIDALGYAHHGVFAANMTGNTVLAGMALAQQEWGTALDRLSTLLTFFLGALVGGCFPPDKKWLYQVPLFLECALLVVAACLDPAGSAWLAVTTAAMGVQASVIVGVGGSTVSTVVVTSTLSKLAQLCAQTLVLVPFFGAAPGKRGPGAALLLAWGAYFVGAAAAGALLAFSWAMWVGTALVILLAPVQRWYRH